MRTMCCVALLCFAAPASAQENEAEFEEVVPEVPATALNAPSGYGDVSQWAVLPGGPDGVNDPMLVNAADYTMIAVGSVIAGISYVMGASLSVFFGAIGNCWWGVCRQELAALGALPVLHMLAGLSNMSNSAGAWVSGGVFAPIEAVGLIILLVGALTRSPRLVEHRF